MRTKQHKAKRGHKLPRAKPGAHRKPQSTEKAAKKRVAVERPALAPVKEDAAPAILTFERLHPAPVVEKEEAPAPAEKPWWKWR